MTPSNIPTIFVKNSKTKDIFAFRIDEIQSIEIVNIGIFEAHERGVDPRTVAAVRINFFRKVTDDKGSSDDQLLFRAEGQDLANLRKRTADLVAAGHLVDPLPTDGHDHLYNSRAIIGAILYRNPGIGNVAKIVAIGDENGHVLSSQRNISDECADHFSEVIEKLFGS